jgi:hypothetical protein
MAKDAILGSNLVDDLVPTVDALRSELHDAFGVRQYRVYTVLRTWSSGITGDGVASDVETEITPKPLVEFYPPGLTYEMDQCGITEAGRVKVREISLQYAEAELVGPTLVNGQEWFIKIADAQGQAIQDRYWVLSRVPAPDRIEDIGWVMELMLAEV